jgi:hypothetical protein
MLALTMLLAAEASRVAAATVAATPLQERTCGMKARRHPVPEFFSGPYLALGLAVLGVVLAYVLSGRSRTA